MAIFFQINRNGYVESIIHSDRIPAYPYYQIRYTGSFDIQEHRSGNERIIIDTGSLDVTITEPRYHPSQTEDSFDYADDGTPILVQKPVLIGWRTKPGTNSLRIPTRDIFIASTGSLRVNENLRSNGRSR